MKKSITILMSLLLAVTVFTFDLPKAEATTETLSEEEIYAKMVEINDKYEVGDVFSDEDSEFVMKYGNNNGSFSNPENIAPYKIFNGTKTYSGQKSSGGVKVYISGTCKINHWNVLKNVYDCTLYGRSNAGDVTVTLEHTAFGLIGEKKIGKVYSRTHKSAKNPRSVNLVNGNQYSAGVAYSLTVVKARAVQGKIDITATDS